MSGKPTLPIGFLFSCLALLWLTGCLSAKNKVARELPSLELRWQAAVAHQAALPERKLDWPQALALLHTNNLKLRSARVGVTNTQELARQVYRDLIPTINLRSGMSQSLKNLPATSLNDVTFNVDSFFNVPGVVNFNARLFSGRLEVLRAQAACQLAEREQTIELYKLFLAAGENDELADELKSERLLADAVRKADNLAAQVLLKDIESQQLSLLKAQEGLQARVGELLTDRSFRWVLTTNSLPELDYATKPLRLDDTNRVAQLQMKLVALELVRAWAQIHGIKLQYWPELTIFVTGPSIYQLQNNESHFWSSSDVIGSANFFWSLDTRGYVSQQLRLTRREQDLQAAQLKQDSLALIDRLLAAQKLASSLLEQGSQLDQLISFLEKIPPDPDLNSILQNAETNRSLRYKRFKVRRDLAELNTVFWFVDEQPWPT